MDSLTTILVAARRAPESTRADLLEIARKLSARRLEAEYRATVRATGAIRERQAATRRAIAAARGQEAA